MDDILINKIRTLKLKYEPEGFIIIGVFGSYARNEETENSDVDILYEMTSDFYTKHQGWDVFPVIQQIEQDIKLALGKKVDLADLNALKKTGRKYILPEVIHV